MFLTEHREILLGDYMQHNEDRNDYEVQRDVVYALYKAGKLDLEMYSIEDYF